MPHRQAGSSLDRSGSRSSNTETRIVDPETGEDRGVDAEGEIWVRGPQVMKGYLGNEQATAETIDPDGWLHTGDVGRIDSDGHLSVVDRVKELIKYKGFQVPPAELEALLVTHPAVADVAVIGVPDDEAGEVPKAFVVLKPGEEASATDLQQHVAGHVATLQADPRCGVRGRDSEIRFRQDPPPRAPRVWLTSPSGAAGRASPGTRWASRSTCTGMSRTGSRWLIVVGALSLPLGACSGSDDAQPSLSSLGERGRDIAASAGCQSCHGSSGRGRCWSQLGRSCRVDRRAR